MTLDLNGKEINHLFTDLVKQKGLEGSRTVYDTIVDTVAEEFSGRERKAQSPE